MSKRTTRKAEIVSKANKGLMEIQNLEISPNPRGFAGMTSPLWHQPLELG